MRSFFHLFSLVALVSTGVFSTPTPPPCLAEICGDTAFVDSSPSPVDFAAAIVKPETPTRSLPEGGAEQLTNSERFIRGLPPKRPKRLQGSPLRRTQPSAVPLTTYRGHIRIDKEDGSGTLGYLSKYSMNSVYNRYQSIDNAAVVTFKFDDTQTSGPASELTSDWDVPAFPILGLVQGRDNTNSDIAPGSYQYLYITGTNPTSPDATPDVVGNAYNSATGASRTSESEVWHFDSVTNEITLQWVNTDGSKPPTYLFTQSMALYAGSDPAKFNAKYPSPVTLLKFTFIPV
ncbi:hypothetical protein FRC01_004842 [Tulasnella sp. 417]|nr:hypothetical protein FRC01_004842 [Tulasnella sp. 417]